MRQAPVIPRIAPRRQQRLLNDKEKGLALTMSAAIHYLIRCMDQMKDTELYSQRLKMIAKQMETELEKHAHRNVWGEEIEGVDINSAADQMEDITGMLHNLLMLAIGMGELHQAQQPLFWLEMSKQIKRFKMPLVLGPDGDLQIDYKQAETAVPV